MKNFLVRMIATVFGVGYCPVAPGTASTAVGVVMAYSLRNNLWVYTAVMLALLFLGAWVSDIMEKQLNKKDPTVACIDEVVGMMIALWGLPMVWPVIITGFFLFRAFDMFKIYPINKLEAQAGGWGIMLDDCMAGLYTNMVLNLSLYLVHKI